LNYSALISFALTKPKVVYAIVLFMVVLSLAMIPGLNIDTDPENMLSVDNPQRVFHNQVKQDFLMRDMIVLGAVSEQSIFTPESLKVLQQLSEQILQIDGVITQDLLSLSVVDNIRQAGQGAIRFEYLMKQAPTTTQGAMAIKTAIKRLPMLNNTLVSGDERAIAIYVPIKAKDLSYIIAEKIRALTAPINTPLAFHITGLPVAEDQFGYEMFVQMGVAAPLAGLAIFLLLWYFFGNLALIYAPMIVAMATVIIIMGSLIGAGFTVHIMSSMIAIFLMPIAVIDSVHILSEFADRFKPGNDPKTVIKQVMGHLFTPMLYTSITSAVGFYSLLLTPIPPVKVFGFFIGTGILLAFLLTITFIPASISRMSSANLEKLQNALQKMEQKSRLADVLNRLGGFATTRGRLILISFIAIFALSIEGITRIEINDNPVNWFKADHQIRVADKVLNNHFAGTYDAWLVFDNDAGQNTLADQAFLTLVNEAKAHGLNNNELNQYLDSNQNKLISPALVTLLDELSFSATDEQQAWFTRLYDMAEAAQAQNQTFLQPALLNWMAHLQQQLVATGLVGKTNGLTDIVSTVNRELHSGEHKDFAIPATANGVAQTLLQYQSSHRPQDLWHFVAKDYQRSLVWLQMTSGDNQHTSNVVAWVETYIKQNPPPIKVSYQWAGKSYLNIVWQDAMVNGMLNSLMSSFVIVFLMMVLLFRSLKYGILAMLPLTFTITFIYGLIGWIGKAYDMPIAVLSALTLGLSIDFAIHFLQRVRELEKETGRLTIALKAMFEEPSRAISRNAIVIAIGFTPLLLSPLIPYITVGFFLASIMAVSALVTLVLLPALLTLLSTSKES
jgi:predicted RND superfamily exporter protein